jgi:DNA polymerase I-like protein with 3'-5' exonuclease and polymerase domains
VGIPEWNNVIAYPDKYDDIHTTNQKAFNLASRLIAKKLLFRAIYADPEKAAFAYSKDPEFSEVSSSAKYWQKVLDNFFDKYKDLKTTHIDFIRQAVTTGVITSPFGRQYEFSPKKNRRGETYWPIPDILNWPNQGLGADIMAIIRVVTLYGKRKRNIQGDLISTVHDSIVWDATEESKKEIVKLSLDVFENLPYYINKYLGVNWNVALVGEVSSGPNMKQLEECK